MNCPWCGYAPQNGHEPLCLASATVEPPREKAWGSPPGEEARRAAEALARVAPPAPAVVLDLAEGMRRRDVGMARASAGVGEEWRSRARSVLEFVARSRGELTADDLWAAGLEVPEHGTNAIGSVFTTAARDGLIENTHRTIRSARPGNHARAVPVWRSLVFARGVGT